MINAEITYLSLKKKKKGNFQERDNESGSSLFGE